MTQITHDFFDPANLRAVNHILLQDNLTRAKMLLDESTKTLGRLAAHACDRATPDDDDECQGCSDCDCATEYRTIKDYASDFGVTLGGGASAQMTQTAMKEAARQGKDVGQEKSGGYTFHPKVLEAAFSGLLKSIQHV